MLRIETFVKNIKFKIADRSKLLSNSKTMKIVPEFQIILSKEYVEKYSLFVPDLIKLIVFSAIKTVQIQLKNLRLSLKRLETLFA